MPLYIERREHSPESCRARNPYAGARLDRPSATSIASRTTDFAGHTQPEAPEWNRIDRFNNASPLIPCGFRNAR